MPDTDCSWSTESNRPCWVRQSTIRWASTGPTPGSASSWATVAVFRSTGPGRRRPAPRPPDAGRRAPAAGPAPRRGSPITSCSPSASLRARFTVTGSTPAQHATGGGHRIVHPGTGRQPVHAGMPHLADHVDHQQRPTRRSTPPAGAAGEPPGHRATDRRGHRASGAARATGRPAAAGAAEPPDPAAGTRAARRPAPEPARRPPRADRDDRSASPGARPGSDARRPVPGSPADSAQPVPSDPVRPSQPRCTRPTLGSRAAAPDASTAICGQRRGCGWKTGRTVPVTSADRQPRRDRAGRPRGTRLRSPGGSGTPATGRR